jgi:hypothetical protein
MDKDYGIGNELALDHFYYGMAYYGFAEERYININNCPANIPVCRM